MSLTFSLSGKNSVLAVNYFPPIDLSDREYELGFTTFETYNAIPNVTLANNKFYYEEKDEEITHGVFWGENIKRIIKTFYKKQQHRQSKEN